MTAGCPARSWQLFLVYPKPIQTLIDLLARFPGVGPRQAARFVFHILREAPEYRRRLAEQITQIADLLLTCRQCGNIEEKANRAGEEEEALCHICENPKRDRGRIMVVERVTDLRAIENSRVYEGVYHVLGGAIITAEGVVADALRVEKLLQRLGGGAVEEVIIAANPTFEGDATARYLERVLREAGVKVTRLARGLAKGVDLEYVDDDTLREAVLGRH